jgi:hypothetical protein
MGFLSNIGKAISNVVAAPVKAVAAVVKAAPAAVVKAVAPVMNVATVSFVHPVQTVQAIISPTKTVAQVVEKHFEQPLSKQITETVVQTAVYATAVLGAGAVAAKGVAGAASALIPETLKGKVIAGIAAPVVLGAVISKPSETLGAVAELPSGLANVGANLAGLATDPSLANVKALVTENPVIVGAAAAAAAVLGAKALLPAIATARQTEAIQEQTKAIEGATASMGAAPAVIKTGETIAPTAPVTPKTERVVTTAAKTSGKKRKSSLKAPTQNISQRVNVIVANKANSTGMRQTHKYLNRELLIR